MHRTLRPGRRIGRCSGANSALAAGASGRARRAGVVAVSWVTFAALTTGLLTTGALTVGASSASAAGGYGYGSSTGSGGKVLLVGTFHGNRGRYRTIQSAVNAAAPGDWILVAPGDYHETADMAQPPRNAHQGYYGGVLITTPNLHLRGMNRNTVIVDGTKAGAPACSSAPKNQNFGRLAANGQAYGRNGILVWEANNVTVDNLTACNFLAGPAGASGNEIWWNGGADSATIGLHGYKGSYLTATSTYYGGETTAAQYGIFSSDSAGPGLWYQIYASNFNDSGSYVGACQQVCGMVINHAWMEYNALGYSGTNSGGSFVIEYSQFDHNQDGFDTNTQINGDPPAPQDGSCPNGGISPITHTHSCWVFIHNYSHDNNNPNVPKAGTAGAGPTGTGMTLSGGRNDTVMDNLFANNGAWGAFFLIYPDSSTPEYHQSCSATGGVQSAAFGCVYDPMNDAMLHNTFRHNGYFGNPSNGDYAQVTLNTGQPQNCYRGNDAPNGSSPANLEQTQAVCGPLTTATTGGGALLSQLVCDIGAGSCPPGAKYPKQTTVIMHPLPTRLATMPNPCRGVPANPWCPGGRPA